MNRKTRERGDSGRMKKKERVRRKSNEAEETYRKLGRRADSRNRQRLQENSEEKNEI